MISKVKNRMVAQVYLRETNGIIKRVILNENFNEQIYELVFGCRMG